MNRAVSVEDSADALLLPVARRKLPAHDQVDALLDRFEMLQAFVRGGDQSHDRPRGVDDLAAVWIFAPQLRDARVEVLAPAAVFLVLLAEQELARFLHHWIR